jgi:hypothetical protein
MDRAQILECCHDMYILAKTLAPLNRTLARALDRSDVCE